MQGQLCRFRPQLLATPWGTQQGKENGKFHLHGTGVPLSVDIM